MMTSGDRRDATALIDFWFSPPGSPERFRPHAQWFKADREFDEQLRRLFLPLQLRAAAGQCGGWDGEAEPCLALILLLDQLPRNLYRGSADAFATDALARETATKALQRGFDRSLPAVWRQFIYLPFEHSESLADQEHSLQLFAALATHGDFAETFDYAKRHHAIVARFGRFPHRNRALGRPSTREEDAFLQEPNSSF